MTKKQQGMLYNYKRATATELDEVYTTYSTAKKRACKDCKRICMINNGINPSICSANTFGFTFAFLYVDSDKNVRLYYMTPQNNYDFIVNEPEILERYFGVIAG